MDRNDVDWKGYIPAITTPFDAVGAYDEKAQLALLEWLGSIGLHGLVVAGTTGEWFSMTPEERERQIRITGERLKGKMTLLCGCNAYTAREALDYAAVAAEAGFDGILVCPPPYVVPTDNEIYEFFKEISDSSPLPICVYNWTRGTNVDLPLPLIERLAELEKVVALKNSTPSLGNFLKTFFAMRDRIRIFGFGMDPIGTSMIYNEGGDGLMGAGAVLGSDQPDFFNAIWSGDLARARALRMQRWSRDQNRWHRVAQRWLSALNRLLLSLNQMTANRGDVQALHHAPDQVDQTRVANASGQFSLPWPATCPLPAPHQDDPSTT